VSALWTTAETAAYLNVSPETILRWHRAGKLRGFPISTNAIRFDADEVRAWLEGRRADFSERPMGLLEKTP
jgi:excisionase family DNA binding protein